MSRRSSSSRPQQRPHNPNPAPTKRGEVHLLLDDIYVVSIIITSLSIILFGTYGTRNRGNSWAWLTAGTILGATIGEGVRGYLSVGILLVTGIGAYLGALFGLDAWDVYRR